MFNRLVALFFGLVFSDEAVLIVGAFGTIVCAVGAGMADAHIGGAADVFIVGFLAALSAFLVGFLKA